MLRLLYDPDTTVQTTTKTVFLPIFSDWANSLDVNCSRLLNLFIVEISRIIKAITEVSIHVISQRLCVHHIAHRHLGKL